MKKTDKTIAIYLTLVIGICYLFGLLELLTKSGFAYKTFSVIFTFIPVISALITKAITKEKSKYPLSIRVWKNPKVWIISALLPGVMTSIGATLYFLVFSNKYSGVFKYGMMMGTNDEILIKSSFNFVLICIIISALMIPIQLLELGEEIGWRGYLLGFQVEKYGERKAVIINGIEWGLVHLPLIYFGFNYERDNWGAPWTNMLVMLISCIVIGIILSFVTIKTKNCMYAAIMHGAFNIIGEVPVYLSNDVKRGLLGPNPSGLLTIAPLIILSIGLLMVIEKANERNVNKSYLSNSNN